MAIYRKFTRKEKNIIAKHLEWNKGISTGERANFSNADLSCTDFSGLDLTKAIFAGANLSEANFSRAIVSYCNFNKAILNESIFFKTVAFGADMTHGSIKDVNFTHAFLKCSDLTFSELTDSIFNNTDLSYVHVHDHHFMKSKIKNCHLANTFFI